MLSQSLSYIDDTAQGMMTDNPITTHETRTAGAVMIMKDAALVLMGLA
jgi:hypothetical protein